MIKCMQTRKWQGHERYRQCTCTSTWHASTILYIYMYIHSQKNKENVLGATSEKQQIHVCNHVQLGIGNTTCTCTVVWLVLHVWLTMTHLRLKNIT